MKTNEYKTLRLIVLLWVEGIIKWKKIHAWLWIKLDYEVREHSSRSACRRVKKLLDVSLPQELQEIYVDMCMLTDVIEWPLCKTGPVNFKHNCMGLGSKVAESAYNSGAGLDQPEKKSHENGIIYILFEGEQLVVSEKSSGCVLSEVYYNCNLKEIASFDELEKALSAAGYVCTDPRGGYKKKLFTFLSGVANLAYQLGKNAKK